MSKTFLFLHCLSTLACLKRCKPSPDSMLFGAVSCVILYTSPALLSTHVSPQDQGAFVGCRSCLSLPHYRRLKVTLCCTLPGLPSRSTGNSEKNLITGRLIMIGTFRDFLILVCLSAARFNCTLPLHWLLTLRRDTLVLFFSTLQ